MPGALTHSPADVVSRLLVDLGVGTDPADGSAWPIFAAGEPSLPDNVITVFDTVGRQQGRTHFDGETQEHHGIQIRVRSSTHLVGFTKARAIAVVIDGQYQSQVVIGAISYVVHAITRSGDVNILGKEVPATKRNLFTINALVSLRVDQ